MLNSPNSVLDCEVDKMVDGVDQAGKGTVFQRTEMLFLKEDAARQ